MEYACGRVGGYTCSDLFLKRALPRTWCSRLDDPWGGRGGHARTDLVLESMGVHLDVGL